MEYFIIKNYYEHFHNIKDNNIIIQKMFDMAFFLEKLAHTTFINCNYDTIVQTIKKFEKENDDNKLKRLKLWKEISKLNIELTTKIQKEIIMNSGKTILGEERTNRAIKYLDKYITDRTFIKIE
jgi:anion-transporting  ArsA/GET3 family ATPase